MIDLKDGILAALATLFGGLATKLLTRKTDVRQANAAASVTEAGLFGEPFKQATDLMRGMAEEIKDLRQRVADLEAKYDKEREQRLIFRDRCDAYRLRLIALGQVVEEA